MSLSNYSRAIARIIVIGFVVVWLIADAFFGVKVSQWPPAARYAAFATVVGALTLLTLRVTYGRRARD